MQKRAQCEKKAYLCIYKARMHEQTVRKHGNVLNTLNRMNKSSKYKHAVEPFSEDFSGSISWANLGNLMLRCASLHAGEHGFGYPQMIKLHHAWVLSRLAIEMDKMPQTGEEFSIETWVDRLYRQFTDRHFSVLRPDGTAFGHGTSTWALIDTETRQPANLETLPNGGFTPALIPERPAPIPTVGRMKMADAQKVMTHKAAYSDLDINGHVNSIRYITLLLDCFSAEELKEHMPYRIEMAYCLESYCDDTLDIYRSADAKNANRHLFEIKRDEQTIVRGSVEFRQIENR